MNWPDRDAWEARKGGADCEMCGDIHLEENVHSFLIAEMRQSFVRLPRNQYMTGWTVVALKRHKSELFELDQDELLGFWSDVSDVAGALERVYAAAKINYMVFRNRCPHLHCHLVPLGYDADPHKPINMLEKEVLLTHKEYEEKLTQIRKALA